MMKRNQSDSFVADGWERVAAAERERIEREVRARYAEALARPGFVRRRFLNARLWWTIERELARAIKRAAPVDALY